MKQGGEDSKSSFLSVGESFRGQGLSSSKGSLKRPVRGRLFQAYGRKKLSDFKDFVFHKGWEFEVSGSGVVKSVAAGQVLYKGRMPGYEEILIIDHGERYYSLYGRLAEIEVERGQIVDAEQVLSGISSSERSQSSRFYFELRKNGKAIDPAPFFLPF